MNSEGWKVAQTRVLHRRSRGGRLLRIVDERYLRLDIPCPFITCHQCQPNRLPAASTFSVDTNIVYIPNAEALIHQLDVITSPFLKSSIMLLQSTLEEVFQTARAHYYRVLRELRTVPIFTDLFHKLTHENPNQALLWFKTHIPTVKCCRLYDATPIDVKGIESISVEAFVTSQANERLTDLLALRSTLDKNSVARPVDSCYPKYIHGEELDAALCSGTVVRGTIRVWAAGRFASCLIRDGVECRIDGMEAINRAIDGDEVAVRVVDSEPARVVAVLKRAWRPFAGSLLESDEEIDLNRTTVFFVPLSPSVPRIKIKTHNLERLVGHRFVVRIDEWHETQKFPSGHVIQVLGVIGDQGVESAALLIEYGIRDEPFADPVMEQCPPIDWKVTPEDCAGRVDLRSLRVFSIDPPGCVDIDDALHVTRLPDGNFEVGVHIADVAHFVKENDAIDREAQTRGTSVYLVDRRIDMIPPRLSTSICSLRDNVDRLTFSCVWTLDSDANIINTRFAKTVIRSRAAMAYSDAQKHIDDTEKALLDNKVDSIGRDCRDLNHLALCLRKRRMEDGALTLASPEVRFKLDKTESAEFSRISESRPLDIEQYQLKQANSLVEEFMLLANISVAQQIVTCFPGRALLRRHPPPSQDALHRLVEAVRTSGEEIEVGSSKALADSLDRAAKRRKNASFDNALRIYATRCMNQAVYFGSGSVASGHYLHYGLAAPLYTHFTSPIRRYADLVVHRLLAASLSLENLPSMCKHKSTLSQTTNALNRLNRAAQGVGRASVELFTLAYFDNRQVDADAIVMDVRVDGLTVFVKEFGIEGKIDLLREQKDAQRHSIDDEAGSRSAMTDTELSEAAGFSYDETTRSLDVPLLGSFSMFAPVRVRILVEHRKHGRRKLVLEVIDSCRDGSKFKRQKTEK